MLQQHDFSVGSFVLSPNNLTMSFSGASVNLGWINNSTVWKSLNETYIGAWVLDAPASQVRGSISPADFPGIPSGYYVVLSLSVTSQPAEQHPVRREPRLVLGVSAAGPEQPSTGELGLLPLETGPPVHRVNIEVIRDGCHERDPLSWKISGRACWPESSPARNASARNSRTSRTTIASSTLSSRSSQATTGSRSPRRGSSTGELAKRRSGRRRLSWASL